MSTSLTGILSLPLVASFYLILYSYSVWVIRGLEVLELSEMSSDKIGFPPRMSSIFAVAGRGDFAAVDFLFNMVLVTFRLALISPIDGEFMIELYLYDVE